MEEMLGPESLDRYIRVSNPASWTVLACVLLMTAGILAWSLLGTVEEVESVWLVVQDGDAVGYVDEGSAGRIEVGDAVNVSMATGAVTSISEASEPNSAGSVSNDDAALFPSGWRRSLSVVVDLPDGSYEGQVMTGTHTPFELLFGA